MKWLDALFGTSSASGIEQSTALAKVEKLLESLPAPEASFLACVGLLAARVLNADSHVSEAEKTKMTDILHTEMGLPQPLALAVTNLAMDHETSHSVEYHLVTEKLNEQATREQKHSLIRTLFAIAAESDISEMESDKIASISNALLLPRSDFTALRAEFSQHRSIMKGLRK